jgi:hypothetical protein
LNLPQDLLEVLNVPETQLETQILKLVALELFRQERQQRELAQQQLAEMEARLDRYRERFGELPE